MIQPNYVYRQIQRPVYNGVNIEIHAPQTNMAPMVQMGDVENKQISPLSYEETEGVHHCPRCSMYDIPRYSIYNPSEEYKVIPQKLYVTNPQKTVIADNVADPNHPLNKVPTPSPLEHRTKDNNESKPKLVIKDNDKIKPQKIEIKDNDKTPQKTVIADNVADSNHPLNKITVPETLAVKTQQPSYKKPVLTNDKTEKTDVAEKVTEKKVADAKKIEIVAGQDLKPVIDINTIIAELASDDYAIQADAMGAITQVAQVAPDIAAHLLDVKVIDTLLGIMNRDTSLLETPTSEQLEYRQAIINGKELSPEQVAIASKKAPVELAEQNKAYAMYTLASLQNVYKSEVEKMEGKINSVKDLPGGKEIIKEVETNPNPYVKIAGLSSLNYIQSPEYSSEIISIYQKASQDENPLVRDVAQQAIKLVG